MTMEESREHDGAPDGTCDDGNGEGDERGQDEDGQDEGGDGTWEDQAEGAGGEFRTQGADGPSEFDIHDAEAFSLIPLRMLRFPLDSKVKADLVEASNAIQDWNWRPVELDRAIYADAFLNIEAMASVRMDGKPPSADTIFFEEAEASFDCGTSVDHLVRYQRDRRSLQYALELAKGPCTVESFRSIHSKVLPPRHASTGGRLRDDLKQVGGSRYHLFGGAYTMPAPEDIEPLLEDLARFMNDLHIPVVEQAAIAHAQLVNIHPFERGNGKMARMVVNTTLRYREISPYYLLPFTPVVVTSSHDYVSGIDACKFCGNESFTRVEQSANAWLSYFAICCRKAVELSVRFMDECEEIYRRQSEGLNLRKNSAVSRLLRSLPAMPTFSVQMAADRLGCSFKRASEAAKRLAEEGCVELLGNARRKRIYSCPAVLDAYLHIDALR